MTLHTNWIRSSGTMRSSKSGNFRGGIWEIQAANGDDIWYRVPFFPKKGNFIIIKLGTTVTQQEDDEVSGVVIYGTLDQNGYELITGLDETAENYITRAGITEPDKKAGWNNLSKTLKMQPVLYDKLHLIYGLCGGYSGANQIFKRLNDVNPQATFHNIVSGDYNEAKGITGNGSNKWIDPGLNLTGLGLSYQNLSMGFYSRSQEAAGIPIGMTADSIYMAFGLGNNNVVTNVGSSQPWHTLVDGHNSLRCNASNLRTYVGAYVRDQLAAPSATALTGDVSIMTYGGGNYYTGACSFFYVSDALTDSEQAYLDAAIKTLHIKLGRREQERNVFIGTSITKGTAASSLAQRWSTQVNAAIGGFEVNVGIVASVYQQTSPVANSAQNNGHKRLVADILGQNATRAFIEYNLNDLRHNDAQFDPAVWESQMTDDIQALLDYGMPPENIWLFSPEYNDPTGFASAGAPFNGGSVLREEQWTDSSFNVAQAMGVNYGDFYNGMKDNGGNSLLDPDKIHPNDTGMGVMKDIALAAAPV